jgi:hypothetical protein
MYQGASFWLRCQFTRLFDKNEEVATLSGKTPELPGCLISVKQLVVGKGCKLDAFGASGPKAYDVTESLTALAIRRATANRHSSTRSGRLA